MPPPDASQETLPLADTVVAPAPSRRRSVVVDVMKGLAIILVVMGHTNEGEVHRGWWLPGHLGDHIDTWIYSFHMPAFFFASGLFAESSMRKRGPRHFTLDRLQTMIYPYVIWSCLLTAAVVPFQRFMAQHPMSLRAFIPQLLTGKIGWFLPTLFVCLLVGMFTLRLPRWLVFAVSVLACLVTPLNGLEFTHITFIDRGLKELPFLMAGMWFAPALRQVERVPSFVAAAAALAFGLLLWFVPANAIPPALAFLVDGLLGTAVLLMAARALEEGWLGRALVWCGQASFGIFLVSEFPQGAVREFLKRVPHITNPWVQLLLPTFVAVLIPGWLYHRREQLHIGWLFVWPWRKRGPAPSLPLPAVSPAVR